jgi:hypothetical protein
MQLDVSLFFFFLGGGLKSGSETFRLDVSLLKVGCPQYWRERVDEIGWGASVHYVYPGGLGL